MGRSIAIGVRERVERKRTSSFVSVGVAISKFPSLCKTECVPREMLNQGLEPQLQSTVKPAGP